MSFPSAAVLLGGVRVLRHIPTTALETHEMLLRGLPGAALMHLIGASNLLRDPASLERAVGISLRTVQRRREDPDVRLTAEQSGRAWRFAEILARATVVFGSQLEAEDWMDSPAIGLDQQRPVDLLQTPAGAGMVETLLGQMEYGVYS